MDGPIRRSALTLEGEEHLIIQYKHNKHNIQLGFRDFLDTPYFGMIEDPNSLSGRFVLQKI
jgi:hypothetical protein